MGIIVLRTIQGHFSVAVLRIIRVIVRGKTFKGRNIHTSFCLVENGLKIENIDLHVPFNMKLQKYLHLRKKSGQTRFCFLRCGVGASPKGIVGSKHSPELPAINSDDSITLILLLKTQ